MTEEAADVFNAAWARLRVLERPFEAAGTQESAAWRRLNRHMGMRPHMPLAIGCLALAVVCSLWATTRSGARSDSSDGI